MRTTITIENDVYEVAIRLARSSGEPLGRVLSRLARRGTKISGRFPAFEVAADAPIISASQIQRILDDEGLS